MISTVGFLVISTTALAALVILLVKISSQLLNALWLSLTPANTPQISPKPRQLESLLIVYATEANTCKNMATRLLTTVSKSHPDITIEIVRADTFEPADSFPQKCSASKLIVFIVPTYEDASPSADFRQFYEWLNEWVFDFRVDKNALAALKFAVLGCGDSAFGGNFNVIAKNIDKWFGTLGATRMAKVALHDASDDTEAGIKTFTENILQVLETDGPLTDFVLDEDPLSDEYESEQEAEADGAADQGSEGEMMDVEDLGKVASKLQDAVRSSKAALISRKGAAKRAIGDTVVAEPKSMVTPVLKASLTKQGYHVIGTHSGVKVCRWTKAMLRGRGGCYKHTFYGIASHTCMETTPSLACANKCVFCWRHHTNPVGTEWKWQVDPPGEILDQALENHYRMLKSMKGVPGVKPERFREAMTVRHCALSLVGEPIMYPHINEFIDMLHGKNISSFLVTNAQFPEKILELKPVTQLYVSVDAPTKESLKIIDRPLFSDFWERFLGCLDALGTKGQRTVYRLTLVKDFNTEHIEKYAELVKRGRPDFIEIKGVTFCGYSGSNPLTMANVPYQHEVVAFVKMFLGHLDGQYEISCEHAHSCSVLISHKKFYIDEKWHTWIDYAKFQSLVASGEPFDSMDYIAPTPHWAVYGAPELGFDPEERRVYRNRQNKEDSEPLEIESTGR